MGVAGCQGVSMSGGPKAVAVEADAVLRPAGKMDEGHYFRGRVCLPGHCVGGGSHYILTVTVTSSDTRRLLSGELDGGRTVGWAKVVWTLYARCIVRFLLPIH